MLLHSLSTQHLTHTKLSVLKWEGGWKKGYSEGSGEVKKSCKIRKNMTSRNAVHKCMRFVGESFKRWIQSNQKKSAVVSITVLDVISTSWLHNAQDLINYV